MLEHVTFTARPGETTAFIGSTGSGKSTLINLIPRFYDVSGGSDHWWTAWMFADVPQQELRDSHWLCAAERRAVQRGPSPPTCVTATRKPATRDAAAGPPRWPRPRNSSDELPDGFETAISQGGTNVSGGQRQRLSIARALVKKAPVYIFDDTFSALDFKTDAALRKALKGYTERTPPC